MKGKFRKLFVLLVVSGVFMGVGCLQADTQKKPDSHSEISDSHKEILKRYVCKDTPNSIWEEIIRNAKFLRYGNRASRYKGYGYSVIILMNTAQCQGKYCRAHVHVHSGRSGEKVEKGKCQYLFSTFMDKNQIFHTGLISHKKQKYNENCRTYISGFCLEKINPKLNRR